MDREQAYKFLTERVQNPKLISHSLAAEAVMIKLATYFKAQNPAAGILEDQWGLTGLLHEIDYEKTRAMPEKHGLLSEQILLGKVNPLVIHAIKAHNYKHGEIEPEGLMDWSLYCCDELIGMIMLAASETVDKKLLSLTSIEILNKFNDKAFAEGADREQILMCQSKLGITLSEFTEICLSALKGIPDKLGL